jgi:hypothetical protein
MCAQGLLNHFSLPILVPTGVLGLLNHPALWRYGRNDEREQTLHTPLLTSMMGITLKRQIAKLNKM